eukprot:CAMPEP_0197558568 /NCGR_PEP_ID=MMETSP1320-20131121/19533_1 /TAXON_ID=91990 /ORGANISM="Bolidomonas sp., Strain RCC2347" /LENGTH=124 /DNA_ID=CAMNT_0043119891 /DNA_START=82 /DNA_END=451 /DNA_ORIENTATION=-
MGLVRSLYTAGVAKVYRVTGVVREDPREDRILRDVVEASAREEVEPHQVLKVANLATAPKVRYLELREHLPWHQALAHRLQHGAVQVAQLAVELVSHLDPALEAHEDLVYISEEDLHSLRPEDV